MAIVIHSRFAHLREASFRGAPFEVDNQEYSGGRRLVRHEYPLRDTPFAEDLGRKAGEYPIEAFIIQGRKYEYISARDRLKTALDDAGPATLIHPSLGELTVAVDGYRLKESSREGGYCTFSITFVEAGQAENPGSMRNTAQVGAALAAGARVAALESFLARYLALPQWLEQTLAAAQDAVSLVCACLALPEALIAYGKGIVSGLLLQPLALAGALGRLFPAATPADRGASGGQSLIGFAGGRYYDFTPLAPVFARAMADGYDPYAVDPDPLVSPGPLLAAQIAVQGIISAAEAVMLTEFATADEAMAARDGLLQGLDIAADYAPDSLFGALADLRLGVAVDLTTRGAQLPRVSYTSLSATQPALVAAYQIYGDAGREGELVTRNRVRHPGRVPGGTPLEILR